MKLFIENAEKDWAKLVILIDEREKIDPFYQELFLSEIDDLPSKILLRYREKLDGV